MPSDFDDGQPDRTFKGRGIVDQGRGIAGVYFSLADVPNSTGYFGHVDPTLSVVYEGSRFIVSFPELAELLTDPLDWVSYELGDLSDPQLLESGIGQLREIALSDPRLATAFLAGISDGLQPRTASPGSDPALRSYAATVDVAAAADAALAGMRPVLDEVMALGLSSFPMEVDLDAEQRIGRVAYSFSYPPKEGSEPVELSVEMEFPQYGVQRGLRAPSPKAVIAIDDFFGR